MAKAGVLTSLWVKTQETSIFTRKFRWGSSIFIPIHGSIDWEPCDKVISLQMKKQSTCWQRYKSVGRLTGKNEIWVKVNWPVHIHIRIWPSPFNSKKKLWTEEPPSTSCTGAYQAATVEGVSSIGGVGYLITSYYYQPASGLCDYPAGEKNPTLHLKIIRMDGYRRLWFMTPPWYFRASHLSVFHDWIAWMAWMTWLNKYTDGRRFFCTWTCDWYVTNTNLLMRSYGMI